MHISSVIFFFCSPLSENGELTAAKKQQCSIVYCRLTNNGRYLNFVYAVHPRKVIHNSQIHSETKLPSFNKNATKSGNYSKHVYYLAAAAAAIALPNAFSNTHFPMHKSMQNRVG